MSVPATETSSLLPKAGSEQKKFYFLNASPKSTKPSQQQEQSASASISISNGENLTSQNPQNASFFTWVSSVFQRPSRQGYTVIGNTNNHSNQLKPRMVPVKVEPKVFFANERTFLAWLHMSVTLASISIAIVAFAEANAWSQVYGLLLLPVAISFCVYSLYTYMHRADMIRKKLPGPYEDTVGPLVLSVLLASAISINFIVKVYHLATK